MKFLFNALVIGILVLFLVHPVSTFSIPDTMSVTRNKVLMITATTTDTLLAQYISNTEPQINYTIINIANTNNLTEFIVSQNLHEYFSIFFILSNATSIINPVLIKTFSNFINNNGTLVFISSNVWQLDQAILNFLGINIPSNSSHEYLPLNKQTFQFEITNVSFNYGPYNYQLGENVSISSRVGVIEPINTSIYQIAKSSDLNNRQNFEIYSGIYQTYGPTLTGFALVIPISLVNITNLENETLYFLQSLGYYAIHYSLLMSTSTTNPPITTTTTTTNSTTDNPFIFLDNINFFIIGEYLLGGTLIVGGLLLTGSVATKTLSSLRIKKVNASNEEQEFFSSQESWFVGLLVILASIIGAILYSPNYKRISLFQVLDNPVRNEIIKILEENGFEHFNSLQRKLDIGVSILIWHLRILEEFNIIKNTKIGQYKVVYLVDNPPIHDQVIIYMTFKSKKALAILSLFVQSPAWKILELSDITKSSIEMTKYYCAKLYELGILYFNTDSKQYILVHEKKELVIWLFDRYTKEI